MTNMTKAKQITALLIVTAILLTAATAGYIALSGGRSNANAPTPAFRSAATMMADTPDALLDFGYVPGQLLLGLENPVFLSDYGPNARDTDIFADLLPGVSGVDVLSIIDLTDVSEFTDNGAQKRIGSQILLLELDIEGMNREEAKDYMRDCIEILEEAAGVLYAEHNLLGSACYTPIEPNDPYFDSLWGMKQIQAPEAWELTTGSRGVVVGILDSGIDYDHDDLAANVDATLGHNFLRDNPFWGYAENDVMDDLGHGTHVSGIIAALADNDEGVVGVCHEVTLVPLKIWDSRGYGSEAEFIRALAYAEHMGIEILNVSGRWKSFENWYEGYQGMKAAVQAYSGLIIAAAGNDAGWDDDGDEELGPYVSYPASLGYANIISVAASNMEDELCEFSSKNAQLIDLAAPGEEIYSTLPWGYAAWRGTSMATAHVTGTAALLKAYNPELTVAEIKAAILENVDMVAGLNGTVLTNGRLNTFNALSAVEPGDPGDEILPEYIVIKVLPEDVPLYPNYDDDGYDYVIEQFEVYNNIVSLSATVYPEGADQTITWSIVDAAYYDDEIGIWMPGDQDYSHWMDENGVLTPDVAAGLFTATASNGVSASISMFFPIHR